DGDDYVINGAKMWITNGTQADFITRLARTGGARSFRGMSLIVVPTDTPGCSVSRKLAKVDNHASATAIPAFAVPLVPQANRIGEEGMGFILQMKQFQKERLAGSLMSTAGMEKIVRMTIDYTQGRQAFGRPLIDNQWIHFKLAELLTEIEALRQLN